MIASDGYLEIAGQSLEARFIEGSSGRPVLVMLHEGLGSVSLWRDFPDLLASATGCPVLVWSRTGYGASSSITLPRSLTYMHDEADEVLPHIIAKLGGRDYVLAGHSDGASIAIIYAGSRPLPGLTGLVLLAPHVFVEDISIKGIRAAREAWNITDLRTRLERHHGDNVDNAFLGWNDAWLHPDFRKWDITEFLPSISVPVLAVQGRDDDYGTLAQLDMIGQASGGPVEKLILDDCGHAPQNDQTAAVLDAICGFLTEL